MLRTPSSRPSRGSPPASSRCRTRRGGRSWWTMPIPAWKVSSSTRRPTPPSSRATGRSASRSWRTSPISTPCSCPGAEAASPAASRRRCTERAPTAKVFACEVETAAPLTASLAAGRPTSVDYTASFVDGIGARSVLPELWGLASIAPRGIPRRLPRGNGGRHPPSRGARAHRGGRRRRRSGRRRAVWAGARSGRSSASSRAATSTPPSSLGSSAAPRGVVLPRQHRGPVARDPATPAHEAKTAQEHEGVEAQIGERGPGIRGVLVARLERPGAVSPAEIRTPTLASIRKLNRRLSSTTSSSRSVQPKPSPSPRYGSVRPFPIEEASLRREARRRSSRPD